VTIDLLIVVLGVFIGIQAANWNEMLAEKRRGKAYADSLIDDLGKDLKERHSYAIYYGAVYESAEKSIALLLSNAPDSYGLVINTYRASECKYNEAQTRATWDVIVSSGEIGLLPRDAVAGGLAAYFGSDSAAESNRNILNSPYRTRLRRILPHQVQQAIREGCSDQFDDRYAVVGFGESCDLDVSDTEIAAAAEVLLNDPQLLPDLRLHFSTLAIARSNIAGDIVDLERVIAMLQGNDG